MNLDAIFDQRKREVEQVLSAPRHRLSEIAPKAPARPGVYVIWTPRRQRPLYVGMSGNLRNRLLQHTSGRRGGSQFRIWLAADTSVKQKVFETAQIEELSAWIAQHCDVQIMPFAGDRRRLEKLLTGVLNPILQSD